MKNSYYLLNRVFLLALFFLLFNDLYLKEAFPSFLSGKLSDLTGLIVFVLFFTFLSGNHFKSVIFFATSILFCWWKSSLSDGFIQSWNELLNFYPIERTVDYTDLFCLFILVPAYYYEPTIMRFKYNSQRLVLPVFLVGTFAIAATSKAKNYQAYGTSTYYSIQESFQLKVTRTKFLNELALSNIIVEKNPNAASPSKPSDPHAYILKNFSIGPNVVVESMYISIKEKKNGIKLTIHSAALTEHPTGTTKEVRKIIVGQSEEYFSVTTD
jgi:hypothetical protein